MYPRGTCFLFGGAVEKNCFLSSGNKLSKWDQIQNLHMFPSKAKFFLFEKCLDKPCILFLIALKSSYTRRILIWIETVMTVHICPENGPEMDFASTSLTTDAFWQSDRALVSESSLEWHSFTFLVLFYLRSTRAWRTDQRIDQRTDVRTVGHTLLYASKTLTMIE